MQKIRVQRIKESILNRSDFNEYINQSPGDIHAPIEGNYVTLSLYGKFISENDTDSISTERINTPVSNYNFDDFEYVYIEIDFQTDKESMQLNDRKDYTWIIQRNGNNIDNISRDLKNTARTFKIIQKNRKDYTLIHKEIDMYSEQLVFQDSKSDFESWEDSSYDSQAAKKRKNQKEKEILPPNALLKTGYPEIQKKILDKNEKEHIFYIINKRTYECTVYFMTNVERNRKDLIKYIEKDQLADWQFVYIEVFSKISKEYFRIILKESQVRKVLEWADASDVLFGQEEKKELAHLIVKALDITTVDENQQKTDKKLIISEEKYRTRTVLEQLSVIELQKIGSHLKTIEADEDKPHSSKDDELLVDFSSKLILNEEREFSSGFYDIKIFERRYKDTQISYKFELSLAPPRISDVFIVEFQSHVENRMNRMIVETIGLEDKNPESSESKSIIFTSSVVLSIFENSFPHFIEFTLMEPSTKAEWSHKISTNTLAAVVIKEKFVKTVCHNIKEGPSRKWNTAALVRIPSLAYENLNAIAFEDESFAASIIDFEVQEEHYALASQSSYQKLNAQSRHKLYFYKDNFSTKIGENFQDEEIDGHDKFNEIFRKLLWYVFSLSNKYRKVVRLKNERDVELIIEAHSNEFLKVQIRLLEDEEIVHSYDTWLSYSNWRENSRVYSEIIQVDTNLAFILYYESFTFGGW